MKNTLVTLLIGGISIAASSAATYTVGNNSGFLSNGITDSTGTLLAGTGGSAAFGFFGDETAITSATSAAELLAAFTVFGSSETNFVTPTIPTQFNGLVSSQGTEVAGLPTFSGNNIYLVAGNAASLATATEFLVYRFNDQFGTTAQEPIVSSVTIGTNAGTLLLGNDGSAQEVSALQTPGTGLPTIQTVSLGIIPEPSSALLLGGSLLALGFRRRRA